MENSYEIPKPRKQGLVGRPEVIVSMGCEGDVPHCDRKSSQVTVRGMLVSRVQVLFPCFPFAIIINPFSNYSMISILSQER